MNSPSAVIGVDACIERLIERLGKRLVVGTPLGLGKANHLLNALYRRAREDRSIDLTIVTALTLERPARGSDLAARLLDPMLERIFAGTIELDYARDRRAGALPPNVRVMEFFLSPGQFLKVGTAQRDYISSNYTHVARDLLSRGVNVLLQMVSPGGDEWPGHFSLSCNSDVTLDLVPAMRASGRPCQIIGEINARLPFMYGDAVVRAEYFDALVEPERDGYLLFGPPKSPVTDADHLIGLHASALVRDGGTLQVGIGSLGDAVVYALGLRQEHNALYRDLLAYSGVDEQLVDRVGGRHTFTQGLYGATEMLVDGFLYLYDREVLARRVYDDVLLQTMVNELGDEICPGAEALEWLRDSGQLASPLAVDALAYLEHWGLIGEGIELDGDALRLPDGTRLAPTLDNDATLAALAGTAPSRLRHGALAHGGFYLGPRAFYQRLREMPPEERRQFQMTSVGRINQLYGDEVLDRLQRRDARFINSCIMATLTGAIVSDGLADGRVISGVGGQYNFVAMAHALAGGRSIIKLRSTRTSGGVTSSNIVAGYGHTTIPRHLRDFVVTEYGIADLRGKSDGECVAAMVEIADARFQEDLLAKAKSAGKLDAGYVLPERCRQNTPERVTQQLAVARRAGHFPAFPLGTDLNGDELALGRALRGLEADTATTYGKVLAILRGLLAGDGDGDRQRLIDRMGLLNPEGFKERLYRVLLRGALSRSEKSSPDG